MAVAPALDILLDQLAREERDAWRDYLANTRGLVVHQYEELEPWAWQRLQRHLLDIHRRRTSVSPAGT